HISSHLKYRFIYNDTHILSPSLPFFFYCYGHPRDLHSFPTRRSSDLLPGRLQGTDHAFFPRSLRKTRRALQAHEQISWGTAPQRSEEHTSELQSQSNLVCRLLLEKKKKKKKNILTK